MLIKSELHLLCDVQHESTSTEGLTARVGTRKLHSWCFVYEPDYNWFLRKRWYFCPAILFNFTIASLYVVFNEVFNKFNEQFYRGGACRWVNWCDLRGSSASIGLMTFAARRRSKRPSMPHWRLPRRRRRGPAHDCRSCAKLPLGGGTEIVSTRFERHDNFLSGRRGSCSLLGGPPLDLSTRCSTQLVSK